MKMLICCYLDDRVEWVIITKPRINKFVKIFSWSRLSENFFKLEQSSMCNLISLDEIISGMHVCIIYSEGQKKKKKQPKQQVL